MARRARRERITAAFDAFHATMARPCSVPPIRLSAAAAREHAEAMVEMWLRADGLDAARAEPRPARRPRQPRLADVVRRVAADRAAAFDAWTEPGDRSGPARLAGIVADAAVGRRGGLAPDDWRAVGTVEPDGPVPQLWRIGTGASVRVGSGALPSPERPFPVGVPLLDESHLQSTALARGAPEAERVGGAAATWSRRCCCGWSATSAPGWCSCTSGTSASSPGRCPASTR